MGLVELNNYLMSSINLRRETLFKVDTRPDMGFRWGRRKIEKGAS